MMSPSGIQGLGLLGPGAPPLAPPPTEQMRQGPAIPVEDYEAARVRQEPDFAEFTEFFRQKTSDYVSAVADEYRLYNARNLRNQKYLYGEQFWDVDPETGQIYQLTPERQWSHVDNQFEYFVEAMVAQLMKSAPRLVAKARTDDRHVLSDLRLIQHWLDTDRPFTDEDTLIESYLLVLRSRVWYYTYAALTGGDVERPVYSEKQIGEAGAPAFYCHSCGKSGLLDAETPAPEAGAPAGGADVEAAGSETEAPACPDCGNPAITTIPAQTSTVFTRTGTQSGPAVQIHTEIVDDLQMMWYAPKGKPEHSPILIRDRMMLLDEWADLYPWFDVETAGGAGVDEGETVGIKFFDDLQRSPGNWNADPFTNAGQWGNRPGDDRLRRRCREVWLKPCVYKRWFHKKEQGVELANGKVIPPRVPLGELYPKGMCLVWCGDRIIDVRHEAAKDHWKDLVHKANPAGGQARGVETLIALQDKLNNVNIFKMVRMACESNGNVLVNPRLITDAAARANLNRPGYVVTVGNANGQTDLGRSAASRLQGSSYRPEAGEEVKDTIGSMTGHAQVYSTNEALDKAPINTATGVNEMASQIAQMTEPRLKNRAKVRAEIAEQRWSQARIYQADETYYAAGDKPGKWMTPASLNADVFFEFDPESHVVRTNDQKRADVAAACQLLGEFPPETVLGRVIMQVFGLNDLADNDRRLWEARAYHRLDEISEACAAMEEDVAIQLQVLAMDPEPMQEMGPDGQVVNPQEQLLAQYAQQIVEAVAKPDFRDLDEVFIDVYTRAYASPEQLEWSPLMDACNLLAIQGHIQSAQMKMMMQAEAEGQAQVAAGAPVADDQGARESKKAEEDHERGERAADSASAREMASSQKGPK